MARIESRTYIIRIGDDFSKLLQITSDGETPIDMTGYSFEMQIRKCKSDATAILSLSSPTDIDITDAADGNIIINITDTVTSTLDEVNAVFDLKWTTDLAKVTTILEGNVQILETVTK
jgi:hypothetical protein